MGYYINKMPAGILPDQGKVEFLIKHANAKVIEPPTRGWTDNLVCVAHNPNFDAAAYAFNEEEMKVFLRPDGRRKTWLLVPNAKELAK